MRPAGKYRVGGVHVVRERTQAGDAALQRAGAQHLPGHVRYQRALRIKLADCPSRKIQAN